MSHLWFFLKRDKCNWRWDEKKKLWKKIKMNINIEAYRIVDISLLNTSFNTHHFLKLISLLSLFKLSPCCPFKMTLLWRDNKKTTWKETIEKSGPQFFLSFYTYQILSTTILLYLGLIIVFTFNFYFVINFNVNKIICHILPLIFLNKT